MIAIFLSQNYSNRREFETTAPKYEETLQKGVYNIKLQYEVPRNPNQETEDEIQFGLTPNIQCSHQN